MNQSEQINELAAALAKAQKDISPAIRDTANTFFKSKYADLTSVWGACRDALTKQGLCVIQTMEDSSGKLVLVTTLAHSSGQWIRSSLPIISQKQDAQGIGSAITYMRRYSLAALVGVTTDDDDDGNAACGNNQMTVAPAKVDRAVTAAEAKELQALLDECSQEYQKNVRDALRKDAKIENLAQLTLSTFDRIKKKALEKRAEYQASLGTKEF